MNEPSALLYPLAGMFSIILSLPLLVFWNRNGWPRMTLILTLLGTILASWRYFDISQPNADVRLYLFLSTLIPALITAIVAGVLEIKFRLDALNRQQPYQGRRRKSRSASASS